LTDYYELDALHASAPHKSYVPSLSDVKCSHVSLYLTIVDLLDACIEKNTFKKEKTLTWFVNVRHSAQYDEVENVFEMCADVISNQCRCLG